MMEKVQLRPLNLKERLTNVSTIHLNSMTAMSTVSTLDIIPASISLGVEMDLFNIKADKKYLLFVSLQHENDEQPTISHITTIHLTVSELTFITDGYGKANGTFTFNITVLKEGNYRLIYQLMDHAAQEICDELEQLYHFTRR